MSAASSEACWWAGGRLDTLSAHFRLARVASMSRCSGGEGSMCAEFGDVETTTPGHSCSEGEDEIGLISHRHSARYSEPRATATGHVSCRRLAASGLGVVALVVCAGVVRFSGSAPASEMSRGKLTARMLLECPEVHDAATENIISAGQGVLGGMGAEGPVRRLVAEAFLNTSSRLAQTSPVLAEALDGVTITDEDKEHVIRSLRALSDPRLQRLGVKVAHAVRDASSEDPDVVKHHIAQRLAPHMSEMLRLHRELFPPSSRISQALGYGDFADLLSPKRIQLMNTVSDGWDVELSVDLPAHVGAASAAERPHSSRRLGASYWSVLSSSTTKAPTYVTPSQWSSGFGTTTNRPIGISMAAVGVIGAVLTEATCLLRIMRPMAKLFSNDLNVPPVVTSSMGAADYVFELASCELNAAADMENPLEVLGCPLEFGSEAMDALRNVFALLGILGDNNPANGAQGNKNNNSTVHYGLLKSLLLGD